MNSIECERTAYGDSHLATGKNKSKIKPGHEFV